MAKDTEHFAHQEWIGFVQPVGLVVSAPALLAAQAHVNRNIASEHARFLACLPRTTDGDLIAEIRDLKEFTQAVLGWDAADLSPVPDSATLPAELACLEVILPEYHETLRPTFAVKEFAAAEGKSPWLMLVKEVSATLGLDEAHAESDRNWQASPHAKFERLLRETQVPIGLLSNGQVLRLIYAPRGETSGYVTFSVAEMAQVAGRPIFAALHMLLSAERLFSLPENQRLPAILTESRKYQNTVSTKLAEQVLAALYELLRGFQSANDQRHGELLKKVLEDDPNHVYSGLLTVLMRLVFVLYAEDRGLMPTDSVYSNHYSIAGLFDRLRAEAGRYPDTMDHRYGAWSGLLTLFRLIYEGGSHGDMRIPRRRGYLFDPDRYPFLEGRQRDTRFDSGESLDVPRVSDGVVFRVLSNLLVLDGERLSYRTLDVEQIGSVYETIMGFNLEVAQGRSIAIKPAKSHGAPSALNLDDLLATPANKRAARFKELTDRDLSGAALTAAKEANSVDDLLAALDRLIARKVTPNVVPAGAMVFQPSDERRRSGSHYTPRSLTEPIVRMTLEPILKQLLEAGPQCVEVENKLRERLDKLRANAQEERMQVAAELERAMRHNEYAVAAAEKQVPHPAQILDLKVCDPAMGSGAFLVEVCRQLGDELVKAWRGHDLLPADIPADEDELLYARRQVAQRCLYGVDKNPMAVDLAKLSLWLATLAKDHPFTFLDHSLRHGDSLVGLTRQQIIGFHWEPKKQKSFAEDLIRMRLDRATEARAEILNARESAAYVDQEQRLLLADESLRVVRIIGDACVSAFFGGQDARSRERIRNELLNAASADIAVLQNDRRVDAASQASIALAASSTHCGKHPLFPFHWEIEFPEVFKDSEAGFSAFVGNPPFLGCYRITEMAGGPVYQHWLKAVVVPSKGQVDLSVFFFHRVYSLLRKGGTFGLLATGTVSFGDNRTVGLAELIAQNGMIYAARTRTPWPGEASVLVSVIHLCKAPQLHRFDNCFLNGTPCAFINSQLRAHRELGEPAVLTANNGLAHTGTKLGSNGFLLDEVEGAQLLHDPKNRAVILPLVGGEEVNAPAGSFTKRFVITFGTRKLEDCENWPELLAIVRDRVRPQRMTAKNHGPGAHGKKYWWQHLLRADQLYAAIADLDQCLVTAQVSTHHAIRFEPTSRLFNHKVFVFAFENYAAFALLQSNVHAQWSYEHSSRHGFAVNYSISKTFATFPFPPAWEGNVPLTQAGKDCYEARDCLMVTRQIGLTETYNRFHDPYEQSSEIVQLRERHEVMDREVLKAYGWNDLASTASYEFLLDYEEESEQDIDSVSGKKRPWRLRWPDAFRGEVLGRLLELNTKRSEEERLAGAAAAEGAKSKKAVKVKKAADAEAHDSAQQEMF